MKIIKTKFKGLLIVKGHSIKDARGYFREMFLKRSIKKNIFPKKEFPFWCVSKSKKNVLRGLHFQVKNPQGKLVRVSRGSVLDVALDIRPGSKTFGKYELFELSDKNFRQLWIPPGFAHGFLVLSEIADFQYKCTQVYDQEDEESIHWKDPDLMISWPTDIDIIVAVRDSNAQSFDEYCTK